MTNLEQADRELAGLAMLLASIFVMAFVGVLAAMRGWEIGAAFAGGGISFALWAAASRRLFPAQGGVTEGRDAQRLGERSE